MRRVGTVFVVLSSLGACSGDTGSADALDTTTTTTTTATTSGAATSASTSGIGTGAAASSSSSEDTSGAASGTTGLDGSSDGGSGDSTTGGQSICGPSNGGGGELGLQAASAPGYEDIPGTLYVPTTYSDARPMPLMLALHGSGDTAANFMNVWQSLAEAEGFIVLVPESISGGASWNPGTDTPVIAAHLDQILVDYNVDECRVYLTGYSAGAHVTYMIGLFNAESFAALGIQAGSLLYAEQGGIWRDQVGRTIPVDIHHGTEDPVVPISEAEHAREELESAGHLVHYETHPGGHEIGPGDPALMWTNISGHSLAE